MNMYTVSRIIDRLSRNFKKEVTEEQRRHLFERLRNLSESELNGVVDRLIDRCKFMPAIAEVMTEAQEALKLCSQRVKIPSGGCESCFGTGIKSKLRKRENQIPFAFRCDDCGASGRAGLSLTIPPWSEYLKDSFH